MAIPPWFRALSFQVLGFAVLLTLTGCVDPPTGEALYVFDDTTRTVLVWDDLAALHGAAAKGRKAPEADRVLKSSRFDRATLAWGGLVLDHHKNRLYLVTVEGTVFVIPNAELRKGDLRGRTELLSFHLGDAGKDPFSSGSVFGQAAFDARADVLYVVETSVDGRSTRIWHVDRAGRTWSGETLTPAAHTFSAAGDREGLGVAADPQTGKVFALFGGGRAIRDGHGDQQEGPRLRQGQSKRQNGAFPAGTHDHGVNLLIGDRTRLTGPLDHGALAFDSRNHELYVHVRPTRAAAPGGILVFGTGQFFGNLNHAPDRTLAGAPPDLRLLAHAPDAHWMVGAGSTTAPGGEGGARDASKPKASLYLWEAPNQGGNAVRVEHLPGVGGIRGLALGPSRGGSPSPKRKAVAE